LPLSLPVLLTERSEEPPHILHLQLSSLASSTVYLSISGIAMYYQLGSNGANLVVLDFYGSHSQQRSANFGTEDIYAWANIPSEQVINSPAG
jgi:hypothetical protein